MDICESLAGVLFKLGNDVQYVPLAFDNIAYRPIVSKDHAYDFCFVGGWANNGFDEKRTIMLQTFKHLFEDNMDKYKVGIFINKNLSHETENAILHSSTCCVNVHDAYQRKLGLDTNERTWKAWGATGNLLSDYVEAVRSVMIKSVELTNTTQFYTKPTDGEYFDNCFLEYCFEASDNMKQQTRDYIQQNHTYTNRVKQLLGEK